MSWPDNAIFWHIYPLGFTGAPIRDYAPEGVKHRLDHLIAWLDYAVELGVNGLLLGPIFTSSTHGYDTCDFFTIDPRLGTDKDFDRLVDACTQRGIRLVLDGVFSHVGVQHPALVEAIDQGSTGDDLFDIDWTGDPTPRTFEGHGDLVRLNHSSPKAVALVQKVMRYWLARGIDGWRLDAAYSVAPGFWSRVIPSVREEYPDAWFSAEVIHGDYPEFVSESGVDTLTQYELWKAIWSSIKSKNFYELDHALTRHNHFLETFTPQTFVGNHDVTRIATQVGQSGAAMACAILMTVGGIPSIYYGDERGWEGVKEERLGGDDAIRAAYPASPADVQSNAMVRVHQELIGLRRRHSWLVNATTSVRELTNETMVYRTTQRGGDAYVDVVLDLTAGSTVTITDQDGDSTTVDLA